jgi:hypothetical protein
MVTSPSAIAGMSAFKPDVCKPLLASYFSVTLGKVGQNTLDRL